ncbi:MAG: CHAD domain-containing protein [Candidatus Contendobacter sp.]|jgi:triphosphatase|nr:CHAD domain-containing protein [Gammaproteobacteria bacterium]MCC8993881.1 CHAD domain-containing protein [Candidatus Contendobacter sp.]
MSATLSHVKAKPLHLNDDTTVEDAFSAMVSACLRHAEANRPAVLDGQIEGVHQMRVAFRRLRSGLKIFRPRIPRMASAELVEEIRWLNGWLGPARDWDVFLEEGLTPVFSRFPRKRGLLLFRGKAERLRRNHHQALQAALTEPRYPLLLQRFADWLDRRAWRQDLSDAQQEALVEPALAFATPLLERDLRRVIKQGEAFAELSDEKRHQLRIRIKELRYALDFFASLYPAPAVKAYLGALSALQDCLGIMNDIAVARRLLDEAQLTTASAARQVIEGWYGCRLETHECQFAAIWRRFTECDPPWQS